jgi:undecaprenyl diphosphate synthase
LWTGTLPPVDLVIRTGCEGDPHNSAGFMMWHTAYSQFYFTKTFFPDFSPEEFERAIKNFQKRERRFGQ